jgi:hypothetical protein
MAGSGPESAPTTSFCLVLLLGIASVAYNMMK